jgi:hypothetical protein
VIFWMFLTLAMRVRISFCVAIWSARSPLPGLARTTGGRD